MARNSSLQSDLILNSGDDHRGCVGVVLSGIVVEFAVRGSVADGVLFSGDVLLSINGVAVDAGNIAGLLTGPIDELLRIRISRPHFASPVDVVVTRTPYGPTHPREKQEIQSLRQNAMSYKKEIEIQALEIADSGMLITELTKQNSKLRQQMENILRQKIPQVDAETTTFADRPKASDASVGEENAILNSKQIGALQGVIAELALRNEKLISENSKFQNEISELSTLKRRNNEMIVQLHELRRVGLKINSVVATSDEIMEKNATLHHSKLELIGKNVELKKTDEKIRREMAEMHERYRKREEETSLLESSHSDLLLANRAQEKKISFVTQRLDGVMEELAEIKEKKREFEEKFHEAIKALSLAAEEIQIREKQRAVLESWCHQASTDISNLKKNCESLVGERTETLLSIENLKAKLHEAEVVSASASEGYETAGEILRVLSSMQMASKQGWLKKLRRKSGVFQKMWFTLQGGSLFYFNSFEDSLRNQPQGFYELRQLRLVPYDISRFPLNIFLKRIHRSGNQFVTNEITLEASKPGEAQDWCRAVIEAVDILKTADNISETLRRNARQTETKDMKFVTHTHTSTPNDIDPAAESRRNRRTQLLAALEK